MPCSALAYKVPAENNDLSAAEDRRVQSLVAWAVIALALAGLFALGRPHPWLETRMRSAPAGFLLFWTVFIASILISNRWSETVWHGYVSLCERVFHRLQLKPYSSSLFIYMASLLFFWYFSIQRTDSGDILQFSLESVQGSVFLVEHAPLETLIRCWLSGLLVFLPGWTLIDLFQSLACLYGSVYVLLVLHTAARIPQPYSFLIPLFLFISPVLNLFCGYLEIYGQTNLAQLIYLFAGWFFLWGRISISAVSFGFGIALAMGFWHGVLGLGYLFLLWTSRKRNGLTIIDLCLQGLLVALPTLIALVLLIPYANPFAGIITRLSNPSGMIPLSPSARAAGYTLFSAWHLADWANEMLLVILAPVGLIVARAFSHPRFLFRRSHPPELIFSALGGAASFILGFLYYPVLGYPVDWDLFTFMFPSIALCGVAAMSEVSHVRVWRKRVLALVLLAAALTSVWILQNALFWRYPVLVTKVGPALSPFIPDFYYKQLIDIHPQKNESYLYWLADRALEESPEHYQDILKFMDAWTISALAMLPPQAFDHPGWACDLAFLPGPPDRVLIFDQFGRIFSYQENQPLEWIFAPNSRVDSSVTAADILPDGSVAMLCKDGQILTVSRDLLEKGGSGGEIWHPVERLGRFLPPPPSSRKLPVEMVDLAVQRETGILCVLDNFNRVWDFHGQTLLLEGYPSYNHVVALHLTFGNLPVTIDVNNRLSYDRNKIQFPFENDWFNPIIRDFQFTPDEKGMIILDLNGNLHYIGATPIYRDVVLPGEIVDRYRRMLALPGQDALLLLDNRYRLVKADLDPSGAVSRQKIGSMIERGALSSAYNTLSVLWNKSSHFTSICYDLIDTEVIRNVAGLLMYRPSDAIPMYVDMLPVEDDFIVLLDRWGRLVFLNKGVLFLLDGSGLVSWPRTEAIDGALGDQKILFLCQDGTVWQYPFPRFLGEQKSPFDRTPSKWGDLRDYAEGEHWIGIETVRGGSELLALSANGLLLRLDLTGGALLDQTRLETKGKPLFDMAARDEGDLFTVAYTSREGPAFVYTQEDRQTHEVPTSQFGWDVLSDIQFSEERNIVLLDRYGVIHQYNPILQFSDKPYTVIMDAAALRFLPSRDRAIWLRNNGDMRLLRVKK
ncbi:MAG: hypothetical protein ACE15F_01795 [bacterium]